MATTFTSGTRWTLDCRRTQSGTVSMPAPAVKFVTMTSSKLSAKASRPPERSAVEHRGQEDVEERLPRVGPEVHRRLLQGPGVRRRRAMTLL